MLIVTPGKVTLVNYHPATKHYVVLFFCKLKSMVEILQICCVRNLLSKKFSIINQLHERFFEYFSVKTYLPRAIQRYTDFTKITTNLVKLPTDFSTSWLSTLPFSPASFFLFVNRNQWWKFFRTDLLRSKQCV